MDAQKLRQDIDEFFTIPAADPRLIPAARDLMEALRSLASESHDLQRYHEVSQRMGPAPRYFFTPPDFPYTLRCV